MAEYRNILVIQTAFIGDAILASAVCENLHMLFPSARITILVRDGNQTIYQAHPFLHEVLVWKKSENKIRNLFQLVRTVRKERFDCVINCHRYLSSGIVAAFSGARHIAGYKENPLSFLFNFTARHKIGDGRHETDRMNSLIADLATVELSRLPRLYPSRQDKEAVAQYLRHPFVCMAPASVWFTKQLPREKWIELCGKIPPSAHIYLLGAPGDKTLCDSIVRDSGREGVINLAGKLTLLQSCELMRNAAMNYVNDSAPLHLASAVNAPVTAFFCSTIPAFGFGPLSTSSTTLGVSELPCRPCGLHGYKACPLGHFKCGHNMPLPAIDFQH